MTVIKLLFLILLLKKKNVISDRGDRLCSFIGAAIIDSDKESMAEIRTNRIK